MMLAMDLVAGILFGLKNRGDVNFSEVRSLLIWMGIGMVLGVTLLLSLLGAFALFQSARNLLSRSKTYNPIASHWRIVYGTVGGVLSALFGTGGPLYIVYIARRLPSETARRATVAFLILIASLGRLGLFIFAGLIFDPRLGPYLMLCLPVCLAAVYTGSLLRKRLHVRHLNQLVWVIVGIAGISLLWRHFPTLAML